MLEKYNLVALEKLVLTRHGSFTHNREKCREQISSIRGVLPRRPLVPLSRGGQAQVSCTTCQRDTQRDDANQRDDSARLRSARGAAPTVSTLAVQE